MQTQLKHYRKLAGYSTAKGMADALGMNVNTYRKYEQGATKITLDFACELADVLDVSIDQLAGRAFSDEGDAMVIGVDERMILDAFRKASNDGRRAIKAVARSQQVTSSEVMSRSSRRPLLDLEAAGEILDSLKPTTDPMPEGPSREHYIAMLAMLETLGLECVQEDDGHHVIKVRF